MKRILRWLNIGVFLLFALSATNPFLSLERWLGAGFLGVLFPYTLLSVLICGIIDIIFLPRWAIIAAIILALSWKQISVFFATNLSGLYPFHTLKDKHTLRVITWNVRRFQPLDSNNVHTLRFSLAHKKLLKIYDPDILCLQEFATNHTSATHKYNITRLFKEELHYSYAYYIPDYEIEKNLSSGNAIFSKYPLINGTYMRLPSEASAFSASSALYADILISKKDTIRMLTTHLESYKLRQDDYSKIKKMRRISIKEPEEVTGLFSKIRHSFLTRKKPVENLLQIIAQSPHPIILAGDFNDVPVSYTYFTINRYLKDSFKEKGFGMGRTYTRFLPMLRIDYIFHSPELSVQQTKVLDEYIISDHLPLISDIKF